MVVHETKDRGSHICYDVICFPKDRRALFVICSPKDEGAHFSWYDPSTDNVGHRMFDLDEAWSIRKVPQHYHRTCSALTIKTDRYIARINLAGARVEVERIGDDGPITVRNGPEGSTVTVYDPPGEYEVETNGTRGEGSTALAPGQRVVFKKPIQRI